MAGDTIKFVIEMRDKASAPLKKTGKAAEQSGKQARKAKTDYAALAAKVLALGMALKAAKSTVVALTQGLADSRNELADTATRTGITAKTLAGLRLAAEGSGLQLSNLSGSLALFPKRMRDMQAGIGESKRAFEELGISVLNMDGSLRDADTVLQESLSEIMKIPDATTQAAIATELFGRSGTALLQALSGTELQAFVDQAERFGIDIGPAAAQSAADFQRQVATFSMVAEQSASIFADAFGSRGAGKVLQGLGAALITIATLFGGALKHMREAFGLFVESVEIRFNFLIDLIGAAGKALTGDFSGAADEAGKAIDTMAARFDVLGITAAKVFKDFTEGSVIADAISAGSEFLEAGIAGTGKQRRRFKDEEEDEEKKKEKKEKKETKETKETDPPPTAEELEAIFAGVELALLETASILRENLSPAALADSFAQSMTAPFSSLTAMMGPTGGLIQSLSIMGQEGAGKITKALKDSIKGLIVGLVEVLPTLIVSIPRAIINAVPDLIEGIFLAVPALAEALLIGLPVAIVQGVGRWFKIAWQTITSWFTTDFFKKGEKGREARQKTVVDVATFIDNVFNRGEAQRASGIKKMHTGTSHVDRTGAFLLQAGEAIVPNSGTTTQGMDRRMGGRGGMNVTINTNVVDKNAIRGLGKLLEQEFSSFGRSTSPVFNSPTGTTG